MFFPDLGNACQVDHGPHIRAIGWLSREHPFKSGQVQADFLAVLRTHLAAPMQPVIAMGFHSCELCEGTGPRAHGRRNIWIPSGECTYVAPELIVHYIEAHNYRPPDEFIAAVLACPEQESVEYYKLLRRFPCWWESESGQFPR